MRKKQKQVFSASYHNAEFLNIEVPGKSIPKAIRGCMQMASLGEEARKIGFEIVQVT